MDRSRPHARLGTSPPCPDDDRDPESPRELGLSVRLDQPFHELKEDLIAAFERAYVARCLDRSEMNLSRAARWSGLSRKHLRSLMAKYGIERRVEHELDDDGGEHGPAGSLQDAPCRPAEK